MNRHPYRHLPLAFALALAFGANPAHAQPSTSTPVSIQIAPQALAHALNDWARQTRLQLVVQQNAVAGKTAPAVSGRLSPREALDRLLVGSGLWGRFEESLVTIEPRPAPARGGQGGQGDRQGAPASRLPVVTVTAEPTEEAATGPVHGYAAKRSATATKTDTPILQTPQSISVIGRQEIEAKGMRELLETLNYTPGVFTNIWGHDARGYEFLTLRGFSSATHNYLDGLPQLDFVDIAPITEIYGMERVEVLRGPASATFGRGDVGGVINRASKRPSLSDPVHEIQAQLGNFQHKQLAVDVGEKINDTTAFRIVGLERKGVDQASYPNGQTDKINRRYIAPSLLWQPSGATSLTLLGSFLQQRTGDDIDYLADADGRLTNAREGTPGYSRILQKAWTLGYELRHDFSEAWGFRQNLRYADRQSDKRHIRPSQLQADGRTLTRTAIHAFGKMNQASLDSYLEGRLKAGKTEHRLMAGVDLTRLTGKEQEFSESAPDLDLFNPVYLPIAEPTNLGRRYGPYRLNSVGVYLQDQIKFDERWLLTLSGRQDRARAHLEPADSAPRKRSDSATTGRIGLTWLAPGGWAPYVSYGTSFLPAIGVFDAFSDAPTKGKQWEAGVKFQPLGSNFLLSAAVFDLTKNNIVATNPVTSESEQIGGMRARGFEIEAKGRLTPGLNVTAAYSYTDIKGTRGNTWYVEEGRAPIMTPEQTASLWFDYRLREGALAGLNIGIGARYAGKRWDDPANTKYQGGYTLVDASLRYDLTPHWRLALNATNLLGKVYYPSNAFNSWARGEERTVTATATYRW